MNNKAPSAGTTLIELLVAIFMFGLFLTAISALFVNGYRSYSRGTQKAYLFRDASIAFETMGTDVRQCEKIYMPDKATLASGYFPVRGVGRPFIFVVPGATGAKETLGYTQDNASYAVIRLLYAPNFDPGNPLTWNVQETKILSQSVQSLEFAWSQPAGGPQFIRLNLTSYPDRSYFPLESKVQMQGGF